MRYPKIDFDLLQMFFREPYTIDYEDTEGSLTLYQPTFGDIIKLGEQRFNGTLSLIVGNTTQFRLLLHEVRLDWNEISDFQMFAILYPQLDPEAEKLLFGDIDLTTFEKRVKITHNEDGTENQELVLYNEELNIEIDEKTYQTFHQYYQIMFNMKPEEKLTDDKMLKKWWIEQDQRAAERDEKKTDKPSYSILPLISSYINHPGTKHSLQELKDVGVMEFYDSIQRLQIYESTTALMKGMYSGFVDAKKLKPEDYNFMRSLE